jgi:all-trans-8'-apo-beta-carotenal 15,15'-oxygenase
MHVHGHWFDGDGAIMKCVFAADGRVYSQLRNVDTPARRSLQAGLGANGLRRAWTNRKGGVFGNLLRPPANVANTSVLRLPTVLLALWEGGPPTPLDPITLETLPGHWDFGGDRSSAFTAHPTRTPSGDLFGYGSSPQGFDIMRLAPDGSRILKSHGQALSDVTHSHDFAVTDRHIIVLGSDRIRRAGALRAVAGLCSFGDIFEFDQEKPSVAYFYSRASLELVSQIEVPSTSYYHLANAWHDDATDHTVLLVAKHKEGRRSELEGVFRNMYSRRLHDDLECELWRYEFDVKNAKLCARELAAPSDSACGFELPTVDPRVIGKPTRYVYVTSLLHDGGE